MMTLCKLAMIATIAIVVGVIFYFQLKINMGKLHPDGHVTAMIHNNKNKIGGPITIGPIDPEKTSAADMLQKAIARKSECNPQFHNTLASTTYELRYSDGSKVKEEMVVNSKTVAFTPKCYLDSIGQHMYTRLLFYMCEAGKCVSTCHAHNNIMSYSVT